MERRQLRQTNYTRGLKTIVATAFWTCSARDCFTIEVLLAEPEGHYAEDKRADIKAIIGAYEPSGRDQTPLSSGSMDRASSNKLKKLYARDPEQLAGGFIWSSGLGSKLLPFLRPQLWVLKHRRLLSLK